jgi:hypothetical protein
MIFGFETVSSGTVERELPTTLGFDQLFRAQHTYAWLSGGPVRLCEEPSADGGDARA